jgi:hypothetical protein
MAKYRLRIAHEMETNDGQRLWLPGDVTNESLGDEKGTIVGDGTPYKVRWPTLEMEPLDDEAKAAIAKEEERLQINDGVRDPIEALPIGPAVVDDYEERYIPGMDGRRRGTPLPDGAPIRRGRTPEEIAARIATRTAARAPS